MANDNTPEHQAQHAQQSFPQGNFMAHQQVTSLPPAIWEKLNPDQMDRLLENWDRSDGRWAVVASRNHAWGIVLWIAVLVVFAVLFCLATPEKLPILKELLTHGAAVAIGALGGAGYVKSKMNPAQQG